ncbi:MAG: PEP-CTERM sorting domain-containing protein [Akkermansiaceae bacterium]
MKKTLTTLATLAALATSSQASLVIHGAIDGPLALDGNGGDPKALLFRATADIANLSIYGVGVANNGGGSDGEEFTGFSGSILAGDIIAITLDATHSTFLNNNFTIAQTYEDGIANINGDDPFELYQSGSVIDTYGDVALDGTGEAWEYTDSFAYRTGGAAGAFDINNYSLAGINALDGLDEAGTATALAPAFAAVPEPSSAALLGLAGIATLLRRRK